MIDDDEAALVPPGWTEQAFEDALSGMCVLGQQVYLLDHVISGPAPDRQEVARLVERVRSALDFMALAAR